MKTREIRQEYLTGERALFQGANLKIYDSIFADGESPLKESHDIELEGCMFKWKYPFWYAKNITARNCTWFEMARAGVWYTDNITVGNYSFESLQGMCYIDNLMMKNCKLLNTTLAFEYSAVDAEITGKIDNVMNSSGGVIRAEHIDELILEKDKVDPSKTKIICRRELKEAV